MQTNGTGYLRQPFTATTPSKPAADPKPRRVPFGFTSTTSQIEIAR